jgi:hypothetical protein
VHRHRGAAAVGVAHHVVTAVDPCDLESSPLYARTIRSPRTEGTGAIRPRRP